jgi:TonB family protein
VKNVALLLPLLLVCSGATYAQQSGQSDVKKTMPPQEMCKAAAPKLRESGTNEVVLTMTVDTRGKVESFTTDSPKGLRLEKIKEAAAAIKALHFQPAQKDGQAVKVMVRIKFDCAKPANDAPNGQ